MKNKTLLRSQITAVLALTVLLALWVPAAMAQSSGTSGLTGTVTDPSGAAIPNVTVTLTSNSTGQVRTATTGTDGSYKFSLLPPGDYKVRFSVSGFKTSEVGSVQLNVTETPALDRVLEVGAQTDQITVEATAEVLQTQSSTLGTVVGGTTISEMPLASRNYTQILSLSAGASANVNNGAAFGKGTLDMSVNGAGRDQNNFQMDGISVVNAFGDGTVADNGIYVGIAIPSPDAIQEFKVQTSTYDASYGRNPGANVNVLTRSGSNAFHGTLFEYFRNEDLNATDFFENAIGGGKQQVLKQNQFGGTIGGPLKKDKLFFFGSYQGTRQRNGVASQGSRTTILPPIPGGDRTAPGFQAALGSSFCAANHPGDANYATFASAFGGLQVACDGSNISPVALKIIQSKNPDGSYYIPGSTNGGYQRTQYSIPAKYTGDQYIANVDYLFNSKNTLAGRYLFSEDPQLTPFGSSVPGTPITSYYANTNASLKLTTLVTNNFVNEAHASMQRNIANGADSTPQYTPQGVGITPIVPEQTQPPVMVILNSVSIGGTLSPYYGPATQVQFGDTVSWSHGKHTIRAGGEYEALQWNLSFKSLLRGFLFLPGFDDFLLGRPGLAGCDVAGGCSPGNPGNTTGAPVGTYLFCLFCVKSGPNGIIHGYRERDISWFVQDDWKVSPRLTLNLGVRWEYDGTLSDHYGNLTNIWPSLLQSVPNPPTTPQPTGASLVGYVVPNNYASHYGKPPDGVTTVDNAAPSQNGIPKNNFGPRFGFAWQPILNGHFVIRGGVGLFYDRVGSSKFVHAVEQGDPYALTLDYGDPFSGGAYSLANPFPQRPLGFTPRFFDPATGANSNLNAPFYAAIHTPLTRQYNLGLEYEFLPKWVLEVGYVGSNSLNQANYNHNYNTALLASPSNPIRGQTTNTIANLPYRVPYLGYSPSGLQGTGYDAIANYNSLQVTVRKQYSYGLTFQAAYTWSKDMTNLSWDGQTNVNNASDTGQQYGPAAFSRPQRLVLSYSYELPFGKHMGVLDKLASGWVFSGNTIIQKGTPLTFYDTKGGTAYGTGSAGNGEGGSSRAQLCPGSTYGSIRSSGGVESHPVYSGGSFNGFSYINQSAFCDPPAAPFAVAAPGGPVPTTFGNSGTGVILGPGQTNFDLALAKTTRIFENQSIQLRAEFFNALNHPQFALGLAGQGLARNTPATFGIINSTATNPRLIQFALKYVF